MGDEGGGGSDDFDPHGDPNTDPKDRRRIRYEYRELIAETQKNRHDLIKPDSGGLHKALDKADNLFKSGEYRWPILFLSKHVPLFLLSGFLSIADD